ncbi:hypothetical protein [Sphingomonas mali]|uniref:hypothetical protein n=1 Tax=Sphingomonas mali TaxID=40682 RepID=UPI0012EE26C5|nr:hypothetical protein [Sphingomonas mali]
MPAEHGVTVMRIIRGAFAMSSVDSPSFELAPSNERKRWETPIVIVGSAQRETLSNFNSGGIDVVYTASSIGS